MPSATPRPPRLRGALIKQRTRWMFGSLQAIWKHRSMMLNPRYGWVGMLLLPYAALSILVPLVFLPFMYAIAAVAIAEQGVGFLFLYAAIFTSAQFIIAGIGVLLMRGTGARFAQASDLRYSRLGPAVSTASQGGG